MQVYEITVSGPVPQGPTKRQVTYFVIDKINHAIVGDIRLPDAATFATAFRMKVRVSAYSQDLDVGQFDESGDFLPAGFTIEAPSIGASGVAS